MKNKLFALEPNGMPLINLADQTMIYMAKKPTKWDGNETTKQYSGPAVDCRYINSWAKSTKCHKHGFYNSA